MGWFDRAFGRGESQDSVVIAEVVDEVVSVRSTAPEYDPPATSLVAVQRAAERANERAAFLPGMAITPSRWAGWPSEWLDPTWDGYSGFSALVDTAWACVDLNSSVLSSMPPFTTRDGEIVPSRGWMRNPDPSKYTSWNDFAKEAFWEYQLGEVFLLSMARDFAGQILRFRVVPSVFVTIQPDGYWIGDWQVPAGDMLHIKYARQPGSTRGVGPLQAAGARMVTAAMLEKHVAGLVESGIAPPFYLWTDKNATREQANVILDNYIADRATRPGMPGVLTSGADIKVPPTKSAKEMALLELAQFTDGRIAVLCGVPPFLVGLPSGGDSMTYSNVSQLFDFHERASLGPKVGAFMSALSEWALPRGTAADLNRDAYTRPSAVDRATYYKTLSEIPGVITGPEIRTMERMNGDIAPLALSGLEE